MSYTPAPPMLVRLRGSQAEMGAQHGRLLVEAGGYEQALSFYPRMASAMLSLSIPVGIFSLEMPTDECHDQFVAD